MFTSSLILFNMRALFIFKVSRLILSVAGQKFEDQRIERPEWMVLKNSGASPFNTIPYLEVKKADGSGFTVGQSQTVGEYTFFSIF